MERTALLVTDVQTAIVAGAPPGMLRALSVALDGAHAAGIPVVYIQVLLRPGRAGVSPRNKKLTRLHDMLTEGATGLDVLLRSLDITHLVLTGVSTSTAVLSTALAAADLDFELTVLSDACFNPSGVALHDLLVAELFPAIADVMTADHWVAQWDKAT